MRSTNGSQIYSSMNYGTSWVLEQDNISSNYLGSFAHELEVIDEQNIYVGGVKLGAYNTITNNFTGYNNTGYTNVGIDYIHDDMRGTSAVKIGNVWHVFIATDGGLYKTTDHGITWDFLTPSLDLSEIFDLSTNSRAAGVTLGYQDMGSSLYSKKDETWCTSLVPSDMYQNIHNLERDPKFLAKDINNFGIVFNEQCMITGVNNALQMQLAPLGDMAGSWLVGECVDYKDKASVYLTHKYINRMNLNTLAVTHIADYTDISGANEIKNCVDIINNPHNPDELYSAWNDAGGWGPTVNLSKGTLNASGNYIWEDISIHRSEAATPNTPNALEAVWSIPKCIALNSDIKESLMVGLYKSSVNAYGDIAYLSTNGGQTWVNKSYGLPEKFSVNDLIYQKGSQDRYYAATDVGVYYYDADHVDNGIVGKWKCLSYNLPNVMVTDLEIDYCENKLYAGTFGRGMYALNLMPLDANAEFVVTQSEDWDYYKEIAGNIRVTSGNTLTVTDELIIHGGKLIVEQGAELIVDGGIITSGCSEKKWQGIEVLGDNDLNQLGNNQGRVELKNGARIEHATLGVLLMGRDQSGSLLWGTAGGVLKADNTTFYNCRRGVAFMAYENTTPSGTPVRNHSYFKGCTFEFNDGYNELFSETIYPVGISMWGVDGVRVEGCTFKNEMTTINGVHHNKYDGHAIIVSNSSADIRPLMSNPPFGQPEQVVKRNSFTGFDLGVYVYGIDNTNVLVIRDNIFNDNKLGVYADNSNYISIVENSFTMPHLEAEATGYEVRAAGVYLKETYDFEVEENTFTGTNDGNNYDGGFVIENLQIESMGIIPRSEEIYRNNFDDLGFAALAYGNNGGEYVLNGQTSVSGFELSCNDFGQNTNNYQDVYVHTNASVQPEQGQPGATTDKPAGNRFSPAPAATPYGHIFMGGGALAIDPYYWHGQSQETEPDLSPSNLVIKNALNMEYIESESCPSHIAEDDDLDLVIDYSDIGFISDDIGNFKLNYTNILNGGIGPEIMEVLLDDLSTSQEIRDELIQGSPYLDDNILIAAITRAIPLNQWHLTEILVWNSRLSRNVLNVLAQEQPLTPYQYNLVLNTDGNSQRYLLELEIRRLEKELHQRKLAYILKARQDETVNIHDEMVKLFENESDMGSLAKVVDAQLKQKHYTEADALINNYTPVNINDKFREFYTLKSNLLQANKTWFQMDVDQKRDLDDIIADDIFLVKGKAQSVKRLIEEEFVTFTPKPVDFSLPQPKKAYIGKPDDGFNIDHIMEVNYLQTDRTLVFVNTDQQARYTIVNNLGQVVKTGDLPKEVTTIRVADLPSGPYHIKLQTADHNTCDETFVIQ